MRTLVLLLCACLSCLAQNLITNANFAGSDTDLGIWNNNLDSVAPAITLLKGEGTDGVNAIRIDFSKRDQLKQFDLTLVEGERYKLGAWVRTKNLTSTNPLFTILIYNHGWTKSATTARLPKDTNGEWVLLEKEFTCPPSEDGRYTYSIYGYKGVGTFDVCNPFVIPLSEKAKKDSRPAQKWQTKMDYVYPYYPCLAEVDAHTGEIRCSTSFDLPDPITSYNCRVTYSRDSETRQLTTEFSDDKTCKVMFGSIPVGNATLKLEVIHRASGKVVLANEYPMTAINRPAVSGVQRNNFVKELYRGPLENRVYHFTAEKDGWYRIAFSENQHLATATIDDAQEPALVWRDGEISQTMRLLKMGPHSVKVAGAAPGAEITITQIPQLLLFPFTMAETSYFSEAYKKDNPFVTACFTYDREFTRKKIWPAYNSYIMTHGWSPKTPVEKWADIQFKLRGFEILGSGGFSPKVWEDADAMYKDILNSSPVKTTQGRCLDETAPNDPAFRLVALSKLGWKLQDYDKDIHTWMAVNNTGFFNYAELHRPALASCMNMSQGRGKILLETYVCAVKDTAELNRYMANFPKQARIAQALIPTILEHSIFFISGYLTAGSWNCDCHPETDIKYVYDAFFHTLANDPNCIAPAGIGCYDTKYSDEEYIRWLTKLIKHYCIDGNKEMLSPSYGFTLNPGLIKNCDFENGLDNWTAIPADKDSIKATKLAGLGSKYQCRRSPYHPGTGNTFLQLTRSDKAPNRVSQEITGLVPGKLYSLKFVTFDPDDIVKYKSTRAVFTLRSDLTNVTILPELGYDFRLPRGWNGSYGQKKEYREMHTRKIVFRANDTHATLTFSDWENDTTPGAEIGQKRGINFICVKPYYADEDFDK